MFSLGRAELGEADIIHFMVQADLKNLWHGSPIARLGKL